MSSPNATEGSNSRGRNVSAKADRRTVIRAGAGAAAGAGFAAKGWQFVTAQESGTATVSEDGTPIACVLTPELTEGPFFLNGDLVRKNITEGRPGVPLKLKIGVINPNSCSAVENVAVDIWHCDALGYYSGVAANQPASGDPVPDDLDEIPEDNFLRGIQLTDAEGQVEFDTIYPGWYQGRAIHIHLKVHVGGTADDGSDTYERGHVAHTGQLFFDEGSNDLVFAEEPYASRVTSRLPNEQDRILGDHAEQPGFVLDLKPVSDEAIGEGLVGKITLGVDPDLAP
jgi:protocatechuate 3,4-dioxygenase beta subunit